MIATAFVTALGFRRWSEPSIAPLLVFLAFAVTACVWTPMVPLTDAYALRGVARYGLDYGPLRLWGSAAFVVGALACGLLVDVIAARHLIWVIAAVAGLGAVVEPRASAAGHAEGRRRRRCHGAPALLRDRGFLAIIVASALIQGSHAAYYTFASITWQASGLGGLTIAGLWVLGVLAEIVVFALSPRFTLAPAVLVVIGALSAVARWLMTAQEPSVGGAGCGPTGAWPDLRADPGRHHGTVGAPCAGPCDGAGAGLSRGLRRHRQPAARRSCPVRSMPATGRASIT